MDHHVQTAPSIPPAVDLSGFATVSLEQVLESAPALVRVDRKYLVPIAAVSALLAALTGDFRALQIGGRQLTTYSSRYLDTASLTSCRAHLQGRRRRWKVRLRSYLEDGLHRVEVKTRDGRGATTKHVADATAPPATGPERGVPWRLNEHDAGFVTSALGQHGFAINVASLVPTMHVSYRRHTLADIGSGTRVTIDTGMVCRLDDGVAWLDQDHAVVETKGAPIPGTADRALLRLGLRPRSLSKYASTAALLRSDLPDNDVRRLHGRQLHTSSSGQSPWPHRLLPTATGVVAS